MNFLKLIGLCVLLSITFGCKSAMIHKSLPGEVAYEVTFTGTWTAKSHPQEYPEGGVLSSPHFSGLIGASHNDGYALFAEGSPPTPGLERLSEMGKHSPLDSEVMAAVEQGKATHLFESGALQNPSGSTKTMVYVNPEHKMVSAVAMIAPSPDWFAGAKNITLMKNGKWITEKTVELLAWDSGGDDGESYTASDKDNNPKKATSKNHAKPFMKKGTPIPVGTLTFKKI